MDNNTPDKMEVFSSSVDELRDSLEKATIEDGGGGEQTLSKQCQANSDGEDAGKEEEKQTEKENDEEYDEKYDDEECDEEYEGYQEEDYITFYDYDYDFENFDDFEAYASGCDYYGVNYDEFGELLEHYGFGEHFDNDDY